MPRQNSINHSNHSMANEEAAGGIRLLLEILRSGSQYYKAPRSNMTAALSVYTFHGKAVA